MKELLIILFLILLNGIFAMAEIAMVSAKKNRLERAANKGDKAAKKALELSNNPSKLLSTVQIGITLIGILLGIFSGQQIEDDLQNYLSGFQLLNPYSEILSISIIVIVLTFFSLVLGELVPKRIGLAMPEKISKVLAFPMYFISVIAAPFIWLLSHTTDLLISFLNIKKTKDSYVTEEEIKAIIQEGTDSGAIQEIEQDIVENVFHLGDRKINTLMTQRFDIVWLNLEDSLEINKTKIISSTHKSFPVCSGELDKVEGIITSRDLLNSILMNSAFEIEKIIKPAFYLTEHTSAYKALEKLRETKQRVALVVDEFGVIQGILSMNDMIDALVGDLVEQLHDQKEIIPREDGSYLVDALLPLPEFARYFNIELPDDRIFLQINTVGGLAFLSGRKIPLTGDTFTWKNLSLEIIDMDGRRIDKILVKKLE